jgi:hypothetical protein
MTDKGRQDSMLRRTIDRFALLGLLACASACSTSPAIVVPSCDRPAWLDGKFDPIAPGFTITLTEEVTDKASAAQDLARQFSLELDDQYQTAIEGFAIRAATPDVIAALRCDPRVLGVSFNEHIRMRER